MLITNVTSIAKIARENQWDDIPAIAQAFEKYEHLRRPLMIRIQQATLKRLSQSSKKEWEEYGQQVYCRNFDEAIAALL